MNLFPMICENYNEMSKNFYSQYKEAVNYLQSLNGTSWDYFAHTNEENEKYNSARSLRYHSAIAAIVFQALAVEAFINLYGAQRIGEEKYYTEYEKRGSTTEDKIKKICRDYLKSDYPTNDKAYSRLISLMQKRDAIVHTKPHPVIIDGTPVSYDAFMSQTEFVFKNLDDEILSYDDLKSNLMKTEKKETDIIQELTGMTQSAIQQQITAMYSKGLCGE